MNEQNAIVLSVDCSRSMLQEVHGANGARIRKIDWFNREFRQFRETAKERCPTVWSTGHFGLVRFGYTSEVVVPHRSLNSEWVELKAFSKRGTDVGAGVHEGLSCLRGIVNGLSGKPIDKRWLILVTDGIRSAYSEDAKMVVNRNWERAKNEVHTWRKENPNNILETVFVGSEAARLKADKSLQELGGAYGVLASFGDFFQYLADVSESVSRAVDVDHEVLDQIRLQAGIRVYGTAEDTEDDL